MKCSHSSACPSVSLPFRPPSIRGSVCQLWREIVPVSPNPSHILSVNKSILIVIKQLAPSSSPILFLTILSNKPSIPARQISSLFPPCTKLPGIFLPPLQKKKNCLVFEAPSPISFPWWKLLQQPSPSLPDILRPSTKFSTQDMLPLTVQEWFPLIWFGFLKEDQCLLPLWCFFNQCSSVRLAYNFHFSYLVFVWFGY